MKTLPWSIVEGSCGCFLNPPGHLTYNFKVIEGYENNPNSTISLESAAEYTYVPYHIRDEVKRILNDYVPPPIDSEEVRKWISQVLGYFRGCYRNPDKSGVEQWYASNLLIKDNKYFDPMLSINDHAGVHLIRKWYPDYMPTKLDFDSAKWGD